MKYQPRSESEVFEELKELCTSPGFVHVIAYFCMRDNMIRYEGSEIVPDDIHEHYGRQNLLRTEISTLLGLMAQAPIDFDIPGSDLMKSFVERTDALMNEFHMSMTMASFFEGKDWEALHAEGRNPFDNAAAMREPIFYGGESAYNFQYRALAELKYKADEDWLVKTFGFSITDALQVSDAIVQLQLDFSVKKLATIANQSELKFSVLPIFRFEMAELLEISSLDQERIQNVLDAFSYGLEERNAAFSGVSEFNATNARPILQNGDGAYFLLQHYSLLEAIYDSPFFWMMEDKPYQPTATADRGKYTEEFSAMRLEAVFGTARVLSNVDIYRGKNRYAEADALVLFGDLAIVVQAKSKRLTLAARKGNDNALKDDFKKAVGDAYKQALLCADALLAPADFTFRGPDGNEISIDVAPNAIFPLCVLADHYPALTFQARQFLETRVTDNISAPLVTDVFTLDVYAEFLDTPLQFFNYLDLRARAYDKLMVTSELSAFAYHLKSNLWFDDEQGMIHIAEDFTANVDVAMMVRRHGAEGSRTPTGVLTRYDELTVGDLLEQIERLSIPELAEIGLWLLQLSSDTGIGLSTALDQIRSVSARTGQTKDITIPIEASSDGLTIHYSVLPSDVANAKLSQHCELKKYDLKANSWFGLLLHPADGHIRSAVSIKRKWEHKSEMSDILAKMPKKAPVKFEELSKVRKKIGRNERCPCGSGKKYKACCLRQ